MSEQMREAAIRSLNRYESLSSHRLDLGRSYWGRLEASALRTSMRRAEERWELVRLQAPHGYARRWVEADSATYCNHCGVAWRSEHLLTGVRASSRHVLSMCPECCESEAVEQCVNCTQYCLSQYLDSDASGDLYCEGCGVPERVDVPQYGKGYRPPPPSRAEPAYSVELEMESANLTDLLTELESLQQSEDVGWERDGSLDRDRGIEVLVSCYPTPLELAATLDKVLSAAKGTQTQSWGAASSCGCHVNSNRWRRASGRYFRSGWSDARVARLLHMVRANWGLLVDIAGRESSRWAPLPLDFGGEPLPLQRWASRQSAGKYSAVRVGADRLEWRLFRGSLNPLRLGLYLSTVRYLEDIALSALPAHRLREVSRAALEALLESFRALRASSPRGEGSVVGSIHALTLGGLI